jgi:hypothetical protein
MFTVDELFFKAVLNILNGWHEILLLKVEDHQEHDVVVLDADFVHLQPFLHEQTELCGLRLNIE